MSLHLNPMDTVLVWISLNYNFCTNINSYCTSFSLLLTITVPYSGSLHVFSNKRAMMALYRSPELWNVISNAIHIKTIILTKIQMRPSKCKQDFPSFGLVTYFCLPDMTNIQTWPTYHQDKHSNKVSTCSK